jgi:6-phosphogluconate dehydrogenase
MNRHECQIGIVGLGVMGRNLVLNIADHGYFVAGYDRNPVQVQALKEESQGKFIYTTESIQEFIESLKLPRLIMILVPAGSPVEMVINTLVPYLQAGDILMDGGNSFFLDTERRQKQLAEQGIYFLGVGISGGEKGAREGPCIMPGGNLDAYEKVRPIFESIAAYVADRPCVAYMGPCGAGHYVKMVHNGIEYGLMQLICETYDILKRGLEMNDATLSHLYFDWNKTELNSYLLEITALIFGHIDPDTKRHLIDQIMDVAEEKGTGAWTSEESLKLHQPVPTIHAAVVMRDLSVLKLIRLSASEELKGPSKKFEGNREEFIIQLHNTLYAGLILTYTQGMSLLQQASKFYNYQFNMEQIARIWLGGCIIRSAILNQVMAAFHLQPLLSSLLLDAYFSQELSRCQESLREAVIKATALGIPVLGLMASLSYYDAFRSKWLPANLIQAQRDYFGSHSYKRVDKQGVFHTEWILT